MRRYEWPDITIVTCLLILSLHEFGTCQGVRSWFFGGMAIRMALTLKLHRDLDHDPAIQENREKLSFIDRETRKRIMWTCFIIDILNFSGKNGPNFLSEEIINLQLPIKDRDFFLNIEASTDCPGGENLSNISSEKDISQEGKLSVGIAAYLIRTIALWSRVSHYVNITEYSQYQYPSQQTDSMFSSLVGQISNFDETLPETLKYSLENLNAHDAEGLGNQFLLLHICLQQNILCLYRFALMRRSQNQPLCGSMKESLSAEAKSFEAADKISELLRDGDSYSIMAPIIGYCAFVASTVHLLGAFSKNPSREAISKMNLATNLKYLSKIKNYWGIFSWMIENLKEQYKACADIVKQGNDLNESPNSFLQFSDCVEIYPHGISTSELEQKLFEVKKETEEDEGFGENLGGHSSEKEDSLPTPNILQSSGNRGPKRKPKKQPPAPLITNQSRSGPMPARLNPQNASQPYIQISPITPVNMYHQQPFYNPSLLFPDYQQPNVTHVNQQLALDSYCGIEQPTNTPTMMENPNWDVSLNERGNVDLNMVNYSTEPNSPWILPYNMNSADFIREQSTFDPNICMESDSPRWQ